MNFEEVQIVEQILKFAVKGVPVNSAHLVEAAATLFSTLAAGRRYRLSFRSGILGHYWACSFSH